MSFASAFDNCQLCDSKDLEAERLPMLGGDRGAAILAVLEQDDFIYVHDELDISEVGDHTVAYTAIVKCRLREAIAQENVDYCSIYTRSLTLGFSHFILCKSAWEQLKIEGDYEEGVIKDTSIGTVLCTDDVAAALCLAPKIKELAEKPSNKTMRKQVTKGF